MRVIVCGSREWVNAYFIRERLSKFPANTVIITGGCRGADKMAEESGLVLKFQVWTFHANWRRGDWAGPERNRAMLEVCKPDLVLAFHNDPDNSKGTGGMIELARKAGVPVEIFAEGSDIARGIGLMQIRPFHSDGEP